MAKCPPGYKPLPGTQECVPMGGETMPGSGDWEGGGGHSGAGSGGAEGDYGGGGPGNCPPGQVWRTDSQGAYGSGSPGCEPEDWRHKQDRDTCLGAKPKCGPGYDAWCDFTTASWKCGYIGGGTDTVAGPRTAGGGGGGGGMSYGRGGPSAVETMLGMSLADLAETFKRFAGDVYGVGFPAYQEGVDYYRTLLGKGGRGAMQAATAPAAEQTAAAGEGALKAVGSGYLRGGAREEAEGAIRRGTAGDVARLTAGVQPMAADKLIGAGEAGIGQAEEGLTTAAQIYQNLDQLTTSTRLSEEGLSLQRDLGFANIALGKRGQDIQKELGMAGIGLQYAQLAQSTQQFESSMGFNWAQLGQQASQFNKNLAWQQQQQKSQNSASFGGMFGTIAASVLPAIIAKSAAAYKEEISAAIPAREALRRIVEEAAPALRRWKYKPGIYEVMDDVVFDDALVLDFAPRYGLFPDEEHPGGKVLNTLLLLGDLVGAVAALRAEVAELRELREEVRRGR